MPGPDYHAWTHRPAALGGTDPIEVEPAASGIVSHFPRYPIHSYDTGEQNYMLWPGGVVVVPAWQFRVSGSNGTDATDNYTSQNFARMTTSVNSYASASEFIRIGDPASIGLEDGRAYAILYQYRLGSSVTGPVKVGWTTAADTPALVADTLPTTSPANNWFSLGAMLATVGLGTVHHGEEIDIRCYSPDAVQIDIDQLFFVPHGYQTGSPAYVSDPGVTDTYFRQVSSGQLSSTASFVSPDKTHYFEQSIADTQTVMSVLDPAFRWTSTDFTLYQGAGQQPSNEVDGFAWQAEHGRHMYATARLQGESGFDDDIFYASAAVTIGSGGMPKDSGLLWNNSWQLVYLGQHSPAHEMMHLAGWVIAPDPGGNEAPFTDDGATTVADVRIQTVLEVTCLYDPQSS